MSNTSFYVDAPDCMVLWVGDVGEGYEVEAECKNCSQYITVRSEDCSVKEAVDRLEEHGWDVEIGYCKSCRKDSD